MNLQWLEQLKALSFILLIQEDVHRESKGENGQHFAEMAPPPPPMPALQQEIQWPPPLQLGQQQPSSPEQKKRFDCMEEENMRPALAMIQQQNWTHQTFHEDERGKTSN